MERPIQQPRPRKPLSLIKTDNRQIGKNVRLEKNLVTNPDKKRSSRHGHAWQSDESFHCDGSSLVAIEKKELPSVVATLSQQRKHLHEERMSKVPALLNLETHEAAASGQACHRNGYWWVAAFASPYHPPYWGPRLAQVLALMDNAHHAHTSMCARTLSVQ